MKDVGKGGRNQEMALAVVRKMAEIPNAMFVTLATDGGDGPTDAAGAVVTSETLSRAEIAGLKSDDFLARHDAYHFFDPLGDLLRPGPTQTNVNDLAFLFLF
jgi:hydroxypyruvate reductase